eukprot:TRINITY_DN6833_c0_g1_i1.p1 TRINITY_DN6833_c0_g1~~TRINITY_DN6833_c0_g1_i1.p1  ORF type:complete len:187 (-),score=2.35 TRINITY_DN6833_c0_g1_i1:105-665(-)
MEFSDNQTVSDSQVPLLQSPGIHGSGNGFPTATDISTLSTKEIAARVLAGTLVTTRLFDLRELISKNPKPSIRPADEPKGVLLIKFQKSRFSLFSPKQLVLAAVPLRADSVCFKQCLADALGLKDLKGYIVRKLNGQYPRISGHVFGNSSRNEPADEQVKCITDPALKGLRVVDNSTIMVIPSPIF